MKIVHLFWGLSFGGIETMLVNIANLQYKLGNDVYIIIINKVCEVTLMNTINNGVHIISLNRRPQSKLPFFALKLNCHLNQIKPDVVHLHDTYLYNLLLPMYRKKTCCTLHDLPFGKVRHGSIEYNKLIFSIDELCHRISGNVQSIELIPRVFSISQSVHNELLTKYRVNSEIINNGIVTSNFRQRKNTDRHKIFNIIQVSRLSHRKKGQDLLINAVASLIKKGVKVQVSFVGDGDSLNYLKQLVVSLKVEKYVEFLGKRTQGYIERNLCEYDLFVQPSRYEGFGLTVAEAMAAGLPVLVSSGQGPEEITCGDKFGWIFENDDLDDLIEKIEFIFNHFDEAIIKSKLAREFVVNKYDVLKTVKKYLANYNISN